MKKIITSVGLLILTFVPFISQAHVRFIADDNEVMRYSGYDWKSFFSPLYDSFNLFLIFITIVVVMVLYFVVPHMRSVCSWGARVGQRLDEYKVFVPGLIRITVAIAFIGAGSSMYFISPVLATTDTIAFIQILIGFMLFVGLFVEPLTLASIFLFIMALSNDMYLVGSFDLLALLVVMLVLDAEKPGIDDIFGIKDHIHFHFLRDYIGLILRAGIGFSMMYLALYEKVFNPHLAEFVVRVTDLANVIPVSEAMWVFSAGTIEFVIGLLVLVGFRTRLVSVVAFAVLSLSFFYFGEEVTSHITLFGTLGAILILGPGKISFDNALNKCRV